MRTQPDTKMSSMSVLHSCHRCASRVPLGTDSTLNSECKTSPSAPGHSAPSAAADAFAAAEPLAPKAFRLALNFENCSRLSRSASGVSRLPPALPLPLLV